MWILCKTCPFTALSARILFPGLTCFLTEILLSRDFIWLSFESWTCADKFAKFWFWFGNKKIFEKWFVYSDATNTLQFHILWFCSFTCVLDNWTLLYVVTTYHQAMYRWSEVNVYRFEKSFSDGACVKMLTVWSPNKVITKPAIHIASSRIWFCYTSQERFESFFSGFWRAFCSKRGVVAFENNFRFVWSSISTNILFWTRLRVLDILLLLVWALNIVEIMNMVFSNIWKGCIMRVWKNDWSRSQRHATFFSHGAAEL